MQKYKAFYEHTVTGKSRRKIREVYMPCVFAPNPLADALLPEKGGAHVVRYRRRGAVVNWNCPGDTNGASAATREAVRIFGNRECHSAFVSYARGDGGPRRWFKLDPSTLAAFTFLYPLVLGACRDVIPARDFPTPANPVHHHTSYLRIILPRDLKNRVIGNQVQITIGKRLNLNASDAQVHALVATSPTIRAAVSHRSDLLNVLAHEFDGYVEYTVGAWRDYMWRYGWSEKYEDDMYLPWNPWEKKLP